MCFYELQFGRISLNISLLDSVLETKKRQVKVCFALRRQMFFNQAYFVYLRQSIFCLPKISWALKISSYT